MGWWCPAQRLEVDDCGRPCIGSRCIRLEEANAVVTDIVLSLEPKVEHELWYILDVDKNVVPATAQEANEFLKDTERRRVARTELPGKVVVSTVFLCLNHNFSRIGGMGGPPITFETLIDGGEHDGAMWRYATWREAEDHHKQVVQALKEGKEPT